MIKPDRATASEPNVSSEQQAEEQRFKELVEQARQNVKPIVKRELANETITQEMMAFRFR